MRDMGENGAKTAAHPGAGPGAHRFAVELRRVNKWYGEFHVLRDIDLAVEKGERIVICGPSGSGKSTLIRCINRLEEHQKGTIVVNGVELTNDLKRIDEVRREDLHGDGLVEPDMLCLVDSTHAALADLL